MKIREKGLGIAKRGQSLVEYALVLTLCVVVIISTVNTMKPALQKHYKKSVTIRTGFVGMAP